MKIFNIKKKRDKLIPTNQKLINLKPFKYNHDSFDRTRNREMPGKVQRSTGRSGQRNNNLPRIERTPRENGNPVHPHELLL